MSRIESRALGEERARHRPTITRRCSHCRRALRACGLADDRSACRFATDAGPLAAHGIPSVVLGPGDIAQAHTADEFVPLSRSTRCRRVFERLLCGRGSCAQCADARPRAARCEVLLPRTRRAEQRFGARSGRARCRPAAGGPRELRGRARLDRGSARRAARAIARANSNQDALAAVGHVEGAARVRLAAARAMRSARYSALVGRPT